MSVDAKLTQDLKVALRALARSVVVVSARHEGEAYAMAATAVCEVSMEPPSMLVCVNRSASIFAAIEAGADLAINVLGAEHEAVSRACGGGMSREERFAVGQWGGEDGPPILLDAVAAVILRQAAHIDHGSHRVVIGDVCSVIMATEVDPLVYFDGRYVRIAAA